MSFSNDAVRDLAVNADELDEHSLAYETKDKGRDTRINDFMYTHRDKRFLCDNRTGLL